MNNRLFLALFTSFFILSAQADPVPPATNKDGSPVSGILEAAFNPDPTNPVLPLPTNLVYPTSPPIDLTLDIPTPDPTDLTDPLVAINSLDGYSTTEKWVTTFTGTPVGLGNPPPPGEIDPASVVPGQSVRVFEVTTLGYPYLAVTGIVRELIPLAEFSAVSSAGGVLAIVPTAPLKEYTTYMAVVTNDINDMDGNDATPSQSYNLTKQRTPLVDERGNSTIPLLPDANAQGLEPLRKITLSMELAAASAGVNPADIVLSWTVHTQSITPTLKLLRSIAEPAPTTIAPTPATTPFGRANIHIGIITLPYYCGIPSLDNLIAPLTDFWKAEPGGYIPPFDQLGFLDPNSTNITIANPFPVPTGMQTIPLLLTVPNETSGFTKPDTGWPVTIYLPGVQRNRTDMLAIADAIASTGRVVISMDIPLHGVVPDVAPELAPFYIENTPFADVANERTFDADYWNNETGAFGPDGVMDASGRSAINLANLRATRDILRQTEVDLSILALSVQNMSVDGDASPDLDPFGISLVSHSGGGFVAVPMAALEPFITHVYLNATGGGIMRSFEAGSFGELYVQPFLSAFAGVEPGTPEYEQFLLAAQTVFDSADGINWAAEVVARGIPVVHNQVIGDDTVPNLVLGAPLAGGEALNRVLGLQSYSSTQLNPDGLNGVARYLPPAVHSSLLVPSVLAVTIDMQGQMASFIGSGGTAVVVGDPSLLAPTEPQPAAAPGDSSVKNSPGGNFGFKPARPGAE